MGRYKATCENCRGGKVFSDTLCSYVLADGSMLNLEKTFAWCRACEEVVWAESIPSLDELERRQADHPNADTETRIVWRRSRGASARCLTCGSTDVAPARCGQTHSGNPKWEIECPKCGGTIRVFREPVLSLDRGWIHFSPEGELNQGYEMSPSKGATRTNRKP